MLPLAGALGLGGCGFALRRAPELKFRAIQLAGFKPRSPLADELRMNINASQTTVVVDAVSQAQVVLEAITADPARPHTLTSLARLAQVGLSMVSVQTALEAAGLSVADPGQPRDISGILDQRFQSRWALDVRFNCTSELSEALTFIETFSGVGEVIGPDGTIYEIPFGTPPPLAAARTAIEPSGATHRAST